MKHKNYIFTTCTVLLLLLSACKPEDDTRLYVEKSLLEFPNTGGSQVLKIESDGDWSIYDVPEWLSVSKFSGINTQEIELTALPNYTRLDREHTISVRSNDSGSVLSVRIKQFSYTGGSLFEVDDVKERIFNGGSSLIIEDSIIINSSVRWSITGPSWLKIRYNNVISNMNGNLKEGSGTIYIFNNGVNLSSETLHDTIKIQAEYSDQVVKIPVTKLGTDEVKCVNVLTLTDGIAFTAKHGFMVEYICPGIVEGRKTIAELEKVQWSQYYYPVGNAIIGFDNLKPDTEYTIFLLGMPSEDQRFEKVCLETFRTPSEINQPQANISNVRTMQGKWYCDIEMNNFAKGFYLFSYPLNYDVKKPEFALHLKLNVLNTYMQTGFGYTTEGGTYYFPMFNGYIVSWPVGFDGKLSDMMDVRQITATRANAPSMTKDNIGHWNKRKIKKLNVLGSTEKRIR